MGTLVADLSGPSEGSGTDTWIGPESCSSVPFVCVRVAQTAATAVSSIQLLFEPEDEERVTNAEQLQEVQALKQEVSFILFF